jgi:hypothetical protein
VRIPIMATAREPIKQAGYISATSDIQQNLACEQQPVHTLGHKRSWVTTAEMSAFGGRADVDLLGHVGLDAERGDWHSSRQPCR